MSVELRGVEELKKGLKKMATMDDVKQVIRLNTTEMHQKASRRVRVDSGHLKRSLTIDFSDGGLTGRVSTDVEYSMYVEFGTRFQSAQPFFRPSLYEQREQFAKDMSRLLKK